MKVLTHHIEGALGQEALVCAIELLLASKVPAVDVVCDHVSLRPAVLVAPVLDMHTDGGHVGLMAATRVMHFGELEEALKEGGLTLPCRTHHHHFHAVARHATSVPGLEVVDDGLGAASQESGVQG